MRLSLSRLLIGFLAAILIAGGLLAPVPAQAGLLAFYPFEGNANDASGHGRDGTVNGAALTPSGYEGQAYAFNGSGNYIEVPVDINPGTYSQLTMGAWVQASDTNPIRQVISHDNGGYDRSLGIDNRGGGTGWSAFSGTGAVLGYKSVTQNQWTFLAVVYDQAAGTVTLYADEYLGGMYSNSEPGTLGSGWTFTLIGSNPSYGEYFGGVIDNVFFYDEALSADRLQYIAEHGAAAIVPLPPGLLLLGSGLIGLAGYRRWRS
jgi:hypothetical protein